MNFMIPEEIKATYHFFTNPSSNIECINTEYFYNDGINPDVLIDHLDRFTNRFDRHKIFNDEYKMRLTEHNDQCIYLVMLDCNRVNDKIKVELLIVKFKLLDV